MTKNSTLEEEICACMTLAMCAYCGAPYDGQLGEWGWCLREIHLVHTACNDARGKYPLTEVYSGLVLLPTGQSILGVDEDRLYS